MTMQNTALFETPAAYNTNSYAHPEFEHEWETQETNPYVNSEYENEWESPAMSSYSNSEYENEWEMQEANPYVNSEYENEWKSPAANGYSHPEFEWENNEGEFFFKHIGRFFKQKILPLAKRFAPKVVQSLVSLIPGVGAVAGPLAGQLTQALVREGEMEAAQMEAEFFGVNEFEAEVANTEVAHEAALSEFLASQAAEATTEAEAESTIAATLPITISIMGGKRNLRSVMPILAQASARRARMLTQQGSTGQQILRAVPAMDRRAVAALKSVARSGQPITGATAVKAMAAATNQVMSNPQTLQKAIAQNLSVRQKTAPSSSARNPFNPRRAVARQEVCPTCSGSMR